MKSERIFKNFSALSFDGNAVTGESGPTPSVSQPRLTPESVQDFDVHRDGTADGDAPQPERSGDDKALADTENIAGGVSTTRHRWRTPPVLHGGPAQSEREGL